MFSPSFFMIRTHLGLLFLCWSIFEYIVLILQRYFHIQKTTQHHRLQYMPPLPLLIQQVYVAQHKQRIRVAVTPPPTSSNSFWCNKYDLPRVSLCSPYSPEPEEEEYLLGNNVGRQDTEVIFHLTDRKKFLLNYFLGCTGYPAVYSDLFHFWYPGGYGIMDITAGYPDWILKSEKVGYAAYALSTLDRESLTMWKR